MVARLLAFGFACCTCLALAFSGKAAIIAETSDPTKATSELIDTEIAKVWQRDGVKPANRALDEEFLRRVYLDTVGLPPTSTEARAFLDDERLDKRERLIDSLLADPRFGRHLADLWMPILRERGNDLGELGVSAGDVLAVWLARQFNADVGFDQVISELVTAEGAISKNPASAYYGLMGFPARSPNMAGLTSKHFAGIQIQCAECHDHPYEESWTQQSFKGMASFFTGIEVQANFEVQPVDPRVETVPIPPRKLIEAYAASPDLPSEAINRVEDLLTYDQPQLIGDSPVKTRDTKIWRKLFANWLTGKNNATARRYLVNRYWSFLFGIGLLNPVDDFNSLNEASHPELLAKLGDWFARGYSVKKLYRAILNSRTWQLGSRGGEGGERWHFNRAPVRQLTAEQFFGALFTLRDGDAMLKPFARKTVSQYERLRQFKTMQDMQGDKPKDDYGAKFDEELLKTYEAWIGEMGTDWQLRRGLAARYAALASDDERMQSDTFTLSIDQALSILNGEVTRRLSDSRNGSLIYAIMRDHAETAERVENLYLAILSRQPTLGEKRRALEFLAELKQPEQVGLEDLFYALVSSTEFATNH
ncbi:MAG: DUF1549 domain-containing protein [Planctomycetes bacterium]|nr:DUF1549 domain-containing protein [Planctomycetota bacterium]MCB9935493.1 DUF1549 domain-containing protein [Planctomycetota bacterium]